MATETTRLLDSCIVNIPKEQSKNKNDNRLTELSETKGLSYEELILFKNDPWWQNLRKTFFLSYWLTVIVIFIAACILSVLGHNTCNINISNVSRQIPITTKEFLMRTTTATAAPSTITTIIKNITEGIGHNIEITGNFLSPTTTKIITNKNATLQ